MNICLKLAETKTFVMVDEQSLDALFEAEFENNDSQSTEELFSEAQENVEDARRTVDRMQRAGVSTSSPVPNRREAVRTKGWMRVNTPSSPLYFLPMEMWWPRGREAVKTKGSLRLNTPGSPFRFFFTYGHVELSPAHYECILLSVLLRM